ncbi:MAG: hypothetical protein KJP04_11530 [Arenicella sp.]|nr:hypothetical protein [Arenicella sp.]
MKKVLIGLVVIIAIVGIAATVLVGKLDQIIADVIEKEGSAALGSKVKVESVVTQLAEGIATINGLSVANPAGYKAASAIQVATFSADVDYENQLVERILINQPIINAELKGTKNNFEDLLANMPETEESTEPSSMDDTIITINSFELRKAQINLVADKLGERSFVMEDFVLKNLKGNPEQISGRLTRELTNHVSAQIKDYATGEIGKILAEEAKKKVKQVVDEQIKEKLGDKLGGDLGDKLGVGDKLGDKLKGFKFGKD